MPVTIVGNNTPTAGGVVYGDGTNYVSTSAGTSGQVLTSAGSGAPTWATVSSDPGVHRVVVNTGNGYGSTNTTVRRFQTTTTNTGTAITYADSASLGASFTINTTGVYSVTYADMSSGSTALWGVTLNSTDLSTAIQDISPVTRLVMAVTNVSGVLPPTSITLRLSAGDVIRPQTTGTGTQDNNNRVQFSINRVS